ncbi:MAG: sodium/proline symporter PutP [Oscillospiraceae bacterium]
METNQICILISMLAYLLAMIIIGIVYTKRNKNVDDFYLGGRKLGPLVTAMSAEASDMSSWLLMGLPGVAYFFGIADAAWTAIGLAVGTYINWLIVAKRIRRYSVKLGAITIPDFFSKRYHDNKNILALVAALIIIIFFVPYTASGFAACGKLFHSLFGMDYFKAMVLSAVVIVLYTTLGGFLAASTTDLIQSIVMTLALFIIIGLGEGVSGGFGAVFENAKQLPGYLSMTKSYAAETASATDYGALTIVSTLAWGLGYFGMPHILLRFMATKEEKKLKLSRRIATGWVVISLSVAVLIGIVGYSMSKVGAIPEFATKSEAETIIVAIAGYLSNFGYIPAVIAGVILAGILAATMSTADSQLLAASSSVSQNLLKDFFKINLSQKASMWIARLSVVIISAIAVFIARDPDSSVFDIVSFSWAGFGATFGPVVLTALFWKRSNLWGALAGMISGGVTIFVWKYLGSHIGGIFTIYELLPAFLVALAAIIIVSLLTKAPSKEIISEFEAVAKNEA